MAVPVKRGSAQQHETFSLPEEVELSGDMAMVGGNEDGPDLNIEPGAENENWDLPEGKKPAPKRERAATGEQDEPPLNPYGDGEEDARLAYDDSGEGEPEERESRSRRARRNARRREYMGQQTAQIDHLTKQLEALGGVVERLATGQSGLTANSLDSQITSLEQALRMADGELADAVKTANGDKYAEVTRLRDEVVARLYETKGQRTRLAAGGQAAPQGQANGNGHPPQGQQLPQQQQVDPRLVAQVESKFEAFCDRFPWFDPQSADSDCNIVRAIDTELTTQGYQRHTPVFWQMMEQRMSRYGLTPDGEGRDDEGDERPVRRANGGQARSPMGRDMRAPPRRAGPPTGSGRSTRPNGAGYALSEWQRDALRDEGLLEDKLSDQDVAKRDRIIGKWRKGADALRRAN